MCMVIYMFTYTCAHTYLCIYRHSQLHSKDSAKTNVKEHATYVFFYKFYGFRFTFKPLIHSSLFLHML